MREAGPPDPRFVASADGVPIAYQVRGAGKLTLVLIHGWSCDQSYWLEQLKPLSRDFKLITLDLGGHGQSGTGRTSWTIDSFGQDVAAVVNAVGSNNVILVGHSMGGNVAIAAAERLGARVKGVVWVDTHRQLGSSRSPEEVQKILAPFRATFVDTTDKYVRRMFAQHADPGLVARVARQMSAAPSAIALPALESSLAFDRTIIDRLKRMPVPVIAINSGQAATGVPSLQSYGVEAVTMPGVGHFLMMENPAIFNRLLSQLVTSRLAGSK